MPADCGSPAVCVDSFSVIGQAEQRAALARARAASARAPLERAVGRAHRDRVQRPVELLDAGEVQLGELDRADPFASSAASISVGGAEDPHCVAQGFRASLLATASYGQ